MDSQRKSVFPFLYLYFGLLLLIVLLKKTLAGMGIHATILHIANLFFFITTIIVFLIQKRALSNSNPNVFVRSIMAGVMIKMFLCIVAVLLYRLLAKNDFSKISVFVGMFFYLFYLIAEVFVLLQLNKKQHA